MTRRASNSISCRVPGRGMTLVEVLAALTILSIFVGAVAAWASGSARLTATASASTQTAGALERVAELLRRDVGERPIERAQENQSISRNDDDRVSLPFDVVVNADARSITLVTASRTPGERLDTGAGGTGGTGGRGGGGGWRTVVWRFDAARNELLRGSWEFERAHASGAPIAQSPESVREVRVALRGVRGFDLRERAVAVDRGDDRDAQAVSVWTATISLHSGESTTIVLGPVARNEPGARL